MKVHGVPAASVSGLLLVFGLSGTAGNVIAGKLIDRHLKTLIFTSLLLSALALGMLGMSSVAPLPFWLMGMLLALWGRVFRLYLSGCRRGYFIAPAMPHNRRQPFMSQFLTQR